MALPELIPVRYAEDAAGYLSMRPVVNQTFRLNELMDMIVSVVGKDPERVHQILHTGAVVYNGYHYWWNPIPAERAEVTWLVESFPDDDPSRSFVPKSATAVLLESGGGTQRNLIEIAIQEAKEKKLFAKNSPWTLLLQAAADETPRYEKYSYARHADLFRLTLSLDRAQALLAAILKAAPHGLHNRLSALRPPSALTFVCPRPR
jgi:hypothetical protein